MLFIGYKHFWQAQCQTLQPKQKQKLMAANVLNKGSQEASVNDVSFSKKLTIPHKILLIITNENVSNTRHYHIILLMI